MSAIVKEECLSLALLEVRTGHVDLNSINRGYAGRKHSVLLPQNRMQMFRSWKIDNRRFSLRKCHSMVLGMGLRFRPPLKHPPAAQFGIQIRDSRI